MTIVRIISIGIMMMVALIATFDAVYAVVPCCAYRNGVYVNLKTGKPVKPPASIKAAAPKTGGTSGGSNPGGSMGHSGDGHK